MKKNLGLVLFLQNKNQQEQFSLLNFLKSIVVFDDTFVVQKTPFYPNNPSFYEWIMMDYEIKSGVLHHFNHRGVIFPIFAIESGDYNHIIGFYGWTLQIKQKRRVYDYIYEKTPHGVFFDITILNKAFYEFVKTNDFTKFSQIYLSQIGY